MNERDSSVNFTFSTLATVVNEMEESVGYKSCSTK